MKNFFVYLVFGTLVVLLWLADSGDDRDTSQVLLIATNLLTFGLCSLVQLQICCEKRNKDPVVVGDMAELNEVQVTVNVKMDLKERRSEFHQYRVSFTH